MSAQFLDSDSILSCNEHWKKLEESWGVPVDLETEEDLAPSKLKPVFSSLDLRRTTFDSPFLMKKVRRKLGRQLSRRSVIDYKDFIQDLQRDKDEDPPKKQFYYINGQILSALSVEEICDKIDDIFKSVDKLCSATSTVRQKKRCVPDVVQCSFSYYADLSFDDTVDSDSEKEKGDSDDVDRYIDEAFEQLNSTIASIVNGEMEMNKTVIRDSVTTLVKKFSSILNNPINHSPRRKRQCSDRFKDLAEFWRSRLVEEN